MGAADGAPKLQEHAPELPGPSGALEDTSAPQLDRSQALAEIFRNHHAALVRSLAVRTGSAEDAKEIVQEAYARVLALDRPGKISVLPGYLWRVALNLAIDRKREWAHRRRFSHDVLASPEKREFSAESTCEARERLAIVERAIGELPPKCLEAFVLHVLNGLKFKEVGREMGIGERMATKYVARALEYLQSRLDAADTARRTP
jgi:RNA polymerase sigma-70 factor (ECF subfamily)